MTVVLVTGANSGIGSASVAELLRRGAEVVATVRSDDSEAQLRASLADHADGLARDTDRSWPQRLHVERLDVGDATAAAAVVRRHRPDVVVNNAGAALLGAIADVGDDAALEQLETMVVAPVRLGRLAVATGRCSRVVNVSSVVSDGGVPFTGWYAASKAALDALSDVWRLELGTQGVDVVTVTCGAVATGAWDSAGQQVADGPDPTTAHARVRWAELTSFISPMFADPAAVGAVIAASALDPDPPPVASAGFGAWVGGVGRWVPRPVRESATRLLLGLPRPGRRRRDAGDAQV